MDLFKASNKLSALDLRIPLEGYLAEILWFRVMHQEGDWHINRHTHSSYEFHFVAKGKSRVLLDDGVFVAEAGTFYITAPGVFHEQGSEKGSVYTEYSLNCDFQKISQLQTKPDETADSVKTEMDLIIETLKLAPCRSYPDKYSIAKMFEEALREAYEEKVGFYNEIKSLAVFMIIKAARTVCSGNQLLKSVVPKKLKQDEARYRMIEQFIEDNIQNTIRTSDISQYMHLSEKQVGRIVRSKNNCSTKELIMLVKLKKAKELLKQSNLTQKEIANALGFTSEYYFNQFFKREEGDAPGSFRANTQNV